MGHVIQSRVRRLTLLNLEIFRLKEEDNTRTTFDLKFFSKFFQKKKQGYFIERVKALFLSQNDKISSIW